MFKRSLLASVVLCGMALYSPAFAAIGEYKSVDCSSDSTFSANNCNQCFDGGKVGVSEKILSLFDNWTNANPNEQIIYKDEQVFPQMINLGGEGTAWTQSPSAPESFWKYSDEILWTKNASGTGSVDASGATITGSTVSDRDEFMLEGNKTIRFMDSDLGAFFSLDKTNKQNGEKVGLLAFDINYHNLDSDGNEQTKVSHRECVAFAAKATVVPTPPIPPTPHFTTVKTGPESIFLVALALLLALGIFTVRRRSI